MTQQPQKPQERDETDAALAEALRSAFDSIPVPDHEEAWQSMQKRLEEKRRRRNWRRIGRLGTAAASMVVFICIAAGTINPVFAVTSLYSLVVNKTKDGVVNITFKRNDRDESKALTAPPPEEDRYGSVSSGSSDGAPPPIPNPPLSPNPSEGGEIEYKPVKTTIEQARKELDFPFLAPTELPEGFELTSVEIYNMPDKKPDMAMLNYRSRETDAAGFIMIRESKIVGERATTFGSFSGEQPEVKDVKVFGSKGVLIVTKRTVRLEWSTHEAYYEITSSVGEEATMKLVNSMK
ncbi:DUF4367 domain-containing protein [Paenibacillus contaminans]|nr:DUF4367 domain-containing protein [Paenibacillus contaminans]